MLCAFQAEYNIKKIKSKNDDNNKIGVESSGSGGDGGHGSDDDDADDDDDLETLESNRKSGATLGE